MKCRFCQTTLKHEFIDLVNAPPSNSFLTREQLDDPELYYPLRLFVCHECFLVQINECKKCCEIFKDDYAYFSSYSSTWLEHARRYTEMISERLRLGRDSFVIEVASNDGYLLQYFVQKNVPSLGIEPSSNTAEAAREKGIEVITDFFGRPLADELASAGRKADLIVGNNVLAHVPDLRDFVAGLRTVLKDQGTITLEFPHLMQLVEQNQFDTIYHEHYSYFSLFTVKKILAEYGLEIWDVDQLDTHGGSLRIYAQHLGANRPVSDRVNGLLDMEKNLGMLELPYYTRFRDKADQVKYGFLTFLVEQKRLGKTVAAYGAAAKGNTLLNYCGVKNDLIAFVADRNPHKQGKFLPGSHIPVVGEEEIKKTKPDWIILLPWNIGDELLKQLDYIRGWGGRFFMAIPSATIL